VTHTPLTLSYSLTPTPHYSFSHQANTSPPLCDSLFLHTNTSPYCMQALPHNHCDLIPLITIQQNRKQSHHSLISLFLSRTQATTTSTSSKHHTIPYSCPWLVSQSHFELQRSFHTHKTSSETSMLHLPKIHQLSKTTTHITPPISPLMTSHAN
jgi:hypothetical protein